ncbi:methylmalonate-semialdehyde dehydrogenase, partial [Striga asiatica]
KNEIKLGLSLSPVLHRCFHTAYRKIKKKISRGENNITKNRFHFSDRKSEPRRCRSVPFELPICRQMELDETPQMLPPPPGSFIDREELIQHVGEFAVSQGYVVTIKQSKKERIVVLGCDRGGVYRDRRKPVDEAQSEPIRKRKSGSRLTNCPFELVGKKEDGLWVLSVKNGSHNHEPMKDMSEHPSARRFNEKEIILIKEMTEAGLKPRQILKKLRQTNPELSSTPKHVYNVKAKLRQGNLTVRRLKTLTPFAAVEAYSEPSSSSEPSWKRRYPPRVPNLIGGRFIDSQSLTSIDVLNPATQQVVAQVPLSTGEELKAAVFAAKRAFTLWRNTPVTTRQRIMFKLQELIRRDIDKLAGVITAEQGKTLKDAFNDVSRGIAILLQMFPVAVTCGNTFILKPSEKAPGACVHLAELAMEAGLPSGVLNIIHGTNDIIDAICDDDEIKAVSYIGSDAPGMYVHAKASANYKHVQTNVGARSLAVIMPDANMDATLNALVSAGFGSAVQRCTAISTVIFVGGSNSWIDKLVERAMSLKVGAGSEPGVDIGPVISKQVKERISRVIQTFVENGARLVLDGRNIVVPRFELGNFVGPTILTDVREDMVCYKEEILGPVLLCMKARCLDEAIGIVNRNKYMVFLEMEMELLFLHLPVPLQGNFSLRLSLGRQVSLTTFFRKLLNFFFGFLLFGTNLFRIQIGVNVAIAAPLPLFSFAGSKASFTGDINIYGKTGIQFYTRTKTVTQQWRDLTNRGAHHPVSDTNDDDEEHHVDFPPVGGEFSSGVVVSLPFGGGAHHQMPSRDFLSSQGESMVEPTHGMPVVGDGISSIPALDASQWAVHF